MGKPNIFPAVIVAAVLLALGISYFGADSCSRCDDGNPCTADLCSIDTQYRCMHTALDGEYGGCSGETDECHAKTCSSGACVEEQVSACSYSLECNAPALLNPPYEHYKTALGEPTLQCTVSNLDGVAGKVELSAAVEGYSGVFEKTIELGPNETKEIGVALNFNEKFYSLEESTFSTLKTRLSRSNYTLQSNSETIQMEKATIYAPPRGEEELLAVWVTYNDPCIEEIISEAKKLTPDGEFRAYQREEDDRMEEMEAVFYALRYQNITYVSSSFSTTDIGTTFYNQNVRLPYQSLKYKQMNCVDGAVLYSAILEKLEYETAVAFSPGHAFVLVKSRDSGWGLGFFGSMFSGWDSEWIAIETTDTGDPEATFEDAVRAGQRNLDQATQIVDVHSAIEEGIVPLPVGGHQCGIADLSQKAEEHQALMGN
ncbi:hypothetical protein GF412_01230 [Candidatus Micrarchaeota archaeon]|nr:hypothetical protein [Candidatus Micrarchaeota archaeon]MBD3417595.1 hypothetical protein [Candidatus Micrarchaeota archaeon]